MLAAGTLSVGLVTMISRDAKACGGCFHPPTQVASDITDERMLLSVSQMQTTLYDQIRYSGQPSSFAWVQSAGPAVTLLNATTANPTFVVPSATTSQSYTFTLTIKDVNGTAATDSVIVRTDPDDLVFTSASFKRGALGLCVSNFIGEGYR